MRQAPRILVLATALIAATGPGAPAWAQAASPRPAAFAQCAACHSTEAGKTVFGPSLAGIGGRRAGTLPGYAYSEALRGSGLTWNAATLDRWLTAPQRMVPGTRMPFGGIADRATRRAIVSYLLTLRAP